jgi:hypothetical protein
MSEHTCRVGTSRRKNPAGGRDLYGLPFAEHPDDGRLILSGGTEPVCADCGRGHLRWAEAGYVPWHRICDTCGSHWDLHPVTYIDWAREAPPVKRPAPRTAADCGCGHDCTDPACQAPDPADCCCDCEACTRWRAEDARRAREPYTPRREGWTGTRDGGRIAPVAELDPDPELPEGVTHARLLAAALAAGTEPNGGREDQRVAHACWARRARFYR